MKTLFIHIYFLSKHQSFLNTDAKFFLYRNHLSDFSFSVNILRRKPSVKMLVKFTIRKPQNILVIWAIYSRGIQFISQRVQQHSLPSSMGLISGLEKYGSDFCCFRFVKELFWNNKPPWMRGEENRGRKVEEYRGIENSTKNLSLSLLLLSVSLWGEWFNWLIDWFNWSPIKIYIL